MAEKPTAAQKLLRVQTVYQWLTEGNSRSTICQKVAEMEWGSERTADRYIAEAREMLEQDSAMSRQAFLAESLGNLRRLQGRAEKRGQLQVALNCLRLASELTGLNK